MWKYSGYKLKVTPDLAYLIEAIKVEGWFSLKHREANIQNKNLPLLNNIERILNDYKITVRKRLFIKIKPTQQDFLKSDIVVRNSKLKTIKFHLEKSPFDGSRKVVFNLPYKLNQNLDFIFKNERSAVKVRIGREEINIKSGFQAFAYAEIKFYGIRFLEFLDKHANGWGTYNIRIHPILLKKGKRFIAAAFSALIDCEGSLDYFDLTRKIRVRMYNRDYLEDWNSLLRKMCIDSSMNTEGFHISGWEDFDKLEKLGVKLYHSEKKRKWDKILDSYKKKQVSRGTALEYYIKKLEEIGSPISAAEFAKRVGKKKRVVSYYFKILSKKQEIVVNKSQIKYLYSI